MKKILFLALFAAFTFSVPAQSAAEIAAIRAEVAAINKNIKKYTKSVKNVDDISLEGTEATYYVSGKGLKKITAAIYGETYRASVEIYYSGEEPVFVFYVHKRYNKPMAIAGSKVASTEERRFYYAGGELIKHIVGKKTIGKDDAVFRDNGEEMKKLEEVLKAAY